MRLVNMEAATFLVCEKSLDAEAFFIQATGFLCGGHSADQIQRLLIPLGPTTQHHDWAIRLSCTVDRLQLDQPAWLETRAERIQAEGLALPRRHGARGRATRVGPARLLQSVLESRPIEFSIAQQHHLRPCWDQLADEGDQSDMELFGKVALRSLAHAPGQWQGSTFIDDMDHQRGTPTAHAAAIHDEHQRLQGEMTQQDLRIGQKVDLLQDVGVVAPPRKAFDAALGLGAIRDLRGDVGQLGALAAHDAADKRRQGVEMAGEVPLGGGGIALRECMAYGTIASEVVTHRMLLHMCCSLHTEYTLSQPLKRPSQNNLEKCPVVNLVVMA